MDCVERLEEPQYSDIDLPAAFVFFVKAPGLFIADCIHFFFAIYYSSCVRSCASGCRPAVAFKLFNHNLFLKQLGHYFYMGGIQVD